MPKLIFCLFSLFLLFFSVPRAIETDNVKQLWEQAFLSRIKVIESIHGIFFNPEWKPTFIFDIPDEIPPELHNKFGAQYVPETQSFIISSAFRAQKTVDIGLIDHELGHALADQISRRYGNGMWPDIANYKNLSKNEKRGIDLISEGIGSYFHYRGEIVYPKDTDEWNEWLPTSDEDVRWKMRECLYSGGRGLVFKIIKKHGENGILYLVTHPLQYRDGNIQKAAEEYQKQALKALSKKMID